MFIPVVDSHQRPLMPTISSRARRWIREGKATPFWKRGVFCIRLNIEPSGCATQPVAVGIDPGSKKEGLTVKSASHTYINIQADAVDWVGKAMKTRREMRRARRFRNTPCRANRRNRMEAITFMCRKELPFVEQELAVETNEGARHNLELLEAALKAYTAAATWCLERYHAQVTPVAQALFTELAQSDNPDVRLIGEAAVVADYSRLAL